MPSDYTRIAQALEYLAAHVDEQPGLDQVAAEIGLSPHHLQRLFTRWVGVSPKKFLQYLTLDRAKAALVANSSVLDASLAAGLSGPGRLHDLFVTHEAVTPGEYKAQGQGVVIDYGWAPSPFGDALVFLTPRGMCGLAFAFTGAQGRDEAFADMRRRWPKARLSENRARASDTAERIFGDDQRKAKEPLKLVLHGSPFQIKVWEALLRVPPGALVTYDALAKTVGMPTAARAVGGAVGANPISWLIPCHRVIRKMALGGDYNWVGGYNWGPTRKLAMLGWEAARNDGERLRVAS
jgi:AraC family transcriptional regulator, regulatory protein of adaptative response / methylated-DNA-[protein]-cysteine methyltransferase